MQTSNQPKNTILLKALLITMALIVPGWVSAAVVPAALFSDNAVLQADHEVPVWGWDNPGQQVTVTLGASKATGKVGPDGRWQVVLPAMKASDAPQEMSIAGSTTVTVKNVLVGEVWVGSGQSNMAFPMRWGIGKNMPEYDNAVAQANYPTFRMFTVDERWGSEPPPKNVSGKWVVSTPESVVGWSAAGFFFGRELQKELGGAPVGIILTAVGGTQIESWIPSKAYAETHPSIKPWEKSQWDQSAKLMEAYYAQSDDAAAKVATSGSSAAPAPAKPNARKWPSCLYNGMVAPLMPYAISGIVWYQGESNTYMKDANGYEKMLQAMIKDWREAWKQGDIPFIEIQLPNYSEDLSPGKKAAYAGPTTKLVQADPVEVDSQWPPIREAERHAVAALPNTALVVSIDIGDKMMIHPWDKWDLGHRCALAAMNLAYGKKDLVASGPMVAGGQFMGGKVTVKFTSIGGGLMAKDGGEIKGFALAGTDGKFAWAKAAINGDTVTLSSDEVKDPVEVRYSWAENPIGNLVNKEGLPASPFKLGKMGNP